MRRIVLGLVLSLPLVAVACGGGSDSASDTAFTKTSPGCLTCHGAIEDVHSAVEIPCTDCHGGDWTTPVKVDAHVQPSLPVIMDKTTAPLDYDLPYQQFVNPSNLRVVDNTCGTCHEPHVGWVMKSLMATGAGHYAGGLYQNGVNATKTPHYGNFAVTDTDGDVPTGKGAVAALQDLITYDAGLDQSDYATHYRAVPGQVCARCHLWSRGKGYRGAVGAEGTYRADGCAACHMPYTHDGRSQSADMSIDHQEQGHPRIHSLTRSVPTEQCNRCHHRGARIGLSFAGRSQMPPGLPSGPGVAGTTDVKFNGNYHYTDPETNPPDIHMQLGMNCIDCHTQAGIMGDGNIYGHMDQATKITCRTCHGTPTTPGSLVDKDGKQLNNVSVRPDGSRVLISKIDGFEHGVPQVHDIVSPGSGSYNATAAAAMNSHHLKPNGGLECYACHSSWMPNCFGCHFERDEQRFGTNLITRLDELGKASTGNKVFVSLKHFSMGWNAKGKASPYIVGCQPIADVTAPDGTKKLDFVMPRTQNGKSGLALNPVNPHTTRAAGEVRTCVECHRSPPSLGLGTGNYALAQDRAYVPASDGVRVFDRRTDPTTPALLGTLPAGAPEAVAVVANDVTGLADYVVAASGPTGLHVFDLRAGIPGAAAATVAGIDAADVHYAAGYLYVAVRGYGLRIYDFRTPPTPTLAGSVPIATIERVKLWGVHVFAAAGPAGLVVVDASSEAAPTVVGSVGGMNAKDVTLYAHHQKSNAFAARAYVADPAYGVHYVNLLPEFAAPVRVGGFPLVGAAGLDTYTRYLEASGPTPSREHDYLFVASGAAGLRVLDMTDPGAIVQVGSLVLGGTALDVDVASQVTPPGVHDYALVANATSGLQVVDVTNPLLPALRQAGAAPGATRVAVEVVQLDRFLDEQGNEVKENSHPGAAPFSRADIVRILKAALP